MTGKILVFRSDSEPPRAATCGLKIRKDLPRVSTCAIDQALDPYLPRADSRNQQHISVYRRPICWMEQKSSWSDVSRAFTRYWNFLPSDPLAPVSACATCASSFFLPRVDHRVEPRHPYPTRVQTRSATYSVCFVQWVKKKKPNQISKFENWKKNNNNNKKKKKAENW